MSPMEVNAMIEVPSFNSLADGSGHRFFLLICQKHLFVQIVGQSENIWMLTLNSGSECNEALVLGPKRVTNRPNVWELAFW